MKLTHTKNETYMANAKILRNLYSTDLRWGSCGSNTNFRFGIGGNANFSVHRYQHVGKLNTKISRRGSKPMLNPNVRGFALQWNIGLMVHVKLAGVQ